MRRIDLQSLSVLLQCSLRLGELFKNLVVTVSDSIGVADQSVYLRRRHYTTE